MTGGAFIAHSIAAQLGLDFFYTERHVHPVEGGGLKVEYRLPGLMRAAVANHRMGVVDDVINAGSAVTKTCDELRRFGAVPVVLASILTLGGPPPRRLVGNYPRVISLEHLESSLWAPQSCPLCQCGLELIDPYDPDLR
jgi:orotate phosphoribosyltransferase